MNHKECGRVWTDFFWSIMGPVIWSYDHCDEPPGSLKGLEILD